MQNTAAVYFVVVGVLVAMAAVRSMMEKRQISRGFFAFMGRVEVGAIALLLFSLIFLGVLQIVLRNFFNRGIVWADPFMRHVVLWLGCLGGAMATSRVRHISIDVLTRILPESIRATRDRVIHLVLALASSLLGIATLRLVIQEREFAEDAFLGIGVWVLQCILPIAFFLITYRSLFNAFAGKRFRSVQMEVEEDAAGGATA